MTIQLGAPLDQIQGIGPKFLVKLKKLGIETVRDLLWHFPSRYEDFSKIYKIADLIPHQEATIQAVIDEVGMKHSWRRRFFIVEALLSDDSGSIRAVWFNQPYIKNILSRGRRANFSGRVTASNSGELILSNPTYEFTDRMNFQEPKHTGRLVPIYPETRGLTSKGLRYLIKPLAEKIEKIEEIIPREILIKEKLPEINIAIRQIHFPDTLNKGLAAKKRFAFEGLFLWQLTNAQRKQALARKKAPPIKVDLEFIKTLVKELPFELMLSQKQALWEILKDIQKNQPMNRLLQGDVGSGKTIVAALAAQPIAEAGYQTAFMAPTEILAQQHYKTLIRFFPDFDQGIALLTGKEAKVYYGRHLETSFKKTALAKEIKENKIKIVIGTHALIQKEISFAALALVIVDEQHRFGVEQRGQLSRQIQTVPHFLSMSATPIPRTLSLTVFGDLDLSLITELPKNRKPIITKIVSPADHEKAYAFIKNQIKQGRQAFVICPRIAAPENGGEPRPFGAGTSSDFKKQLLVEVKNVTEEFEKLSKKIFPDLKVAMLHGKIKTREKQTIMSDFAAGKTDILVATSVIEVGIDVPNASIMFIEGADRFGLAQLYQFRGRVGRGEHQSFCFLFSDSPAKTTQQRLKSIIEAKNGFELAEKDLQIRGPGEFLGQTQTGMPDLAMKALQNPDLVKAARVDAFNLLAKDSALKNYPLLRQQLNKFQKQFHLE